MHVFIEKFTGDRYFHWKKNRFGGDASEVPFRMMSDKVLIGTLFDSAPEKSEKGVSERLKQIVNSFKHQLSVKEKVELNDTKDMIYAVFDHLRKKYEKDLVLNSVSESANFKITFNDIGNKCRCFATQNRIEMGVEYIRTLKDKQVSGYKKEREYENRWVAFKKDDLLIWTMIHEFTHLFNGMQHHRHSFFKKVEEIASENAWLFHDGKEKLKKYREMIENQNPSDDSDETDIDTDEE
jgi:hypothetical protein